MPKKISIAVLVVIVLIAGYFSFRQKQVDLVVVDKGVEEKQVVQEVVKLVDGRQCYTYSHDATETEPYATTDFIDITIAGNKVTGTRHGTQKGPDMTNGYTGTMEGTLENNKITSVLSYIVEGSKNKEKEIFQAGLTGIEKLRYQLLEGKGMLVPDMTKPYTLLKYSRIQCEGSN